MLQLLRFLVVACALQLAGGAHLLLDLAGSTASACIDICDCAGADDVGEHGCPLDCADCACPHGRLPSLPPGIAAAVPEPIAWDLLEPWAPYLSFAPPSPPLSSLERPPRG